MTCLHEKGQEFARQPEAWTSRPLLEESVP
jgi:hypothetical protein